MKKLSFFFGFVLFGLFTASEVNASIVVVGNDGKLTWNVLSYEDDFNLDVPQHSSLEVKTIQDEKVTGDSDINLIEDNGKVSLLVYSDKENRELDVSDIKGSLVELEGNPEREKLTISAEEGRFILQQKDVSAITDYPIRISSEDSELMLKTPSGDRFLSVLPYNAAEIAVRSGIINKVDNKVIEIKEDKNELKYIVSGQRVLNLIDLFSYSVPVKMNISALTGKVISIEAPVLYKAIALLIE